MVKTGEALRIIDEDIDIDSLDIDGVASVDIAPDFEKTGEKNDTITQVVESFGDRRFEYMTQTGLKTGTVTDMIATCPAADKMLEQGFAAFYAWVIPHEVSVDDEETDVVEDKDTALQVDEGREVKQPEKVASVNSSETTARPTQETSKAKEASQKVEVGLSKIAVQAAMTPDTGDDSRVANSIVKESKPATVSVKSEGGLEPVSAVQTPMLSSPQEISLQPQVADTQPAVPAGSVGEQGDTSVYEELQAELLTEAYIQPEASESVQLHHEVPIQDTTEKVIEHDEREVVAVTLVDPPLPSPSLAAPEIETLRDASAQFVPEEMSQQESATTQGEVYEDASSQLVMPADSFDTELEISDEVTPADEVVASEADILVPEVIAPEQSIIGQVFAKEQGQEEAESEPSQYVDTLTKLVGEVPPHQTVEYNPMRLNKQIIRVLESVEILQQATSEQECGDRVTSLSHEITELLKLLGYQNPEQLSKQFVRDNEFETLREFITFLLVSIQSGEMAKASSYTTSSILPLHRHRFGQGVVGMLSQPLHVRLLQVA